MGWRNVCRSRCSSFPSARNSGPNWDNDGWRQIGAFSSCVLKPLEWAGFITSQETREPDGGLTHIIFKTPLWRSVLKLGTDRHLSPMVRH